MKLKGHGLTACAKRAPITDKFTGFFRSMFLEQ